jgi:hypothetical protein
MGADKLTSSALHGSVGWWLHRHTRELESGPAGFLRASQCPLLYRVMVFALTRTTHATGLHVCTMTTSKTRGDRLGCCSTPHMLLVSIYLSAYSFNNQHPWQAGS